MGKLLTHRLLPILLIVVLLNLFLAPLAHAGFNYSNGDGTFSLSFDSVDNLGGCSNANFWLIRLSYDDGATQKLGPAHDIGTQGATDSFNIPNGTTIQEVNMWTGTTEDGANNGECPITITTNSFSWQNSNVASPPSISDILVSNVTSSSVTVSWTTSADSDSTVEYGLTSSYGSTTSDGSSTSSHSLSLTGLSASSTYHYKVKSTNGDGTGESGDNTFATPATGQTGEDQSGSSSSSSSSSTASPTPVPDRVGPYISISTDLSKPFLKPPQIAGKATDKSGVAKVEYSIDDGLNWSYVDPSANLGDTSVSFTFTPPAEDDDNYKIKIRATDESPSRNTGVSETYTLIIDRLPPSLIGNIVSIGPQILSPNSDGYLLTAKGIKQKITIATIGGPTQIDLYANHPGAASESAQIYHLTRNSDNGLWSTTLQFDQPGIYTLTSKATDGADNTTEQNLNKIAVLEPGKVLDTNGKSVKDAQVTLYYFEGKYQIWRVWDGKAYLQTNPQKTNADAEFSYLLPSGKYYFDVSANGYQHTISTIFLVDNPTILNPVFKLKPLQLLLDLWLFKIYLPDFSIATAPVEIVTPQFPKITDDLTNKAAPEITLPTSGNDQFDLFNARGKPIVLTFMNFLSPQSYEQLTALDQLNSENYKGYAVLLGNSISKTAIFKQTGGYKTTFVVDADARTVKDYKITTVPTHYFIDRRGIVKKIIPGILNKQEMEDELLNLE